MILVGPIVGSVLVLIGWQVLVGLSVLVSPSWYFRCFLLVPVLVDAGWSILALVGSGCLWLVLEGPGCFWLVLVGPGLSWLVLFGPGYWEVLVDPVVSGCFWLVLVGLG